MPPQTMKNECSRFINDGGTIAATSDSFHPFLSLSPSAAIQLPLFQYKGEDRSLPHYSYRLWQLFFLRQPSDANEASPEYHYTDWFGLYGLPLIVCITPHVTAVSGSCKIFHVDIHSMSVHADLSNSGQVDGKQARKNRQ
jgi:hypothetical protein